MLNITYAPADANLAEQMQADLTPIARRLDHSILVVIVSQESLADKAVREAIQKAQQDGQMVVGVQIDDARPDAPFSDLPLLKMKTYDASRLTQFIKREDLGKATHSANRRTLLIVGGAAMIVFIVSIIAIGSGFVAAPNDEFATEQALQDAQIGTLVAPRLDAVRPRTTQDAENFPLTVEAEIEEYQPFIIGTATAIIDNQVATDTMRQTIAPQTATARAESTPEAGE